MVELQYGFRITEKTALEIMKRGITKDGQSGNSAATLKENINLLQVNVIVIASWTRFR
jgi:hypothetical protein